MKVEEGLRYGRLELRHLWRVGVTEAIVGRFEGEVRDQDGPNQLF